MKISDGPIITEHVFLCSKQKLWNALTDLSHMKQWFFPQLNSFQAKIGFECSFDVDSEGINFIHQWRVLKLQALESITLEWNYAGIEGNSELRFDLKPIDDGTHLKVTHKVLEDFISDLPQFERESGIAGWNYLIKESLAKFLA